MSVGIDWICSIAPSCCSASVSTLAKVTSGFLPETFS